MNFKVKFNSVDEFLDELRKDGATDSISRKIIRATAQYTPNNMTSMIRLVSLVATYRRDDEVIELRRFCGDYWVNMESEGNKATGEKYETALAKIEEFCNKHNLDLRAGIYERMGET